MVDENTIFNIMSRIHMVLSAHQISGHLTLDEEISLKRTLDVAADMWFNPDEN